LYTQFPHQQAPDDILLSGVPQNQEDHLNISSMSSCLGNQGIQKKTEETTFPSWFGSFFIFITYDVSGSSKPLSHKNLFDSLWLAHPAFQSVILLF
jgi:hypothetical protein